MYTTIEADIKKGRVIPLEPNQLPENGRVLRVVLNSPKSRQPWKTVRDRLGWLKLKTDPISWQNQVRGEWDR